MVTHTEHHDDFHGLCPQLLLGLEEMIHQLDDQHYKRVGSPLGVVLEEIAVIQRLRVLLFMGVEVDDVGGDIGVKIVVDTAFLNIDGLELLDNVVHNTLYAVDMEVEAGIQLIHDADELGEFFDDFNVDDTFNVEFPDQVSKELFFQHNFFQLFFD